MSPFKFRTHPYNVLELISYVPSIENDNCSMQIISIIFTIRLRLDWFAKNWRRFISKKKWFQYNGEKCGLNPIIFGKLKFMDIPQYKFLIPFVSFSPFLLLLLLLNRHSRMGFMSMFENHFISKKIKPKIEKNLSLSIYRDVTTICTTKQG